ncbi:unnamed protein product [Plutella xylostella]|uniref:(diamondback moth) hypothetical protein n=1 Tax=Plutella xylostella TaxID=51655 RepID=A0A8S4FPY1_PLUXY|nr:unnamed protein product [Plutella xylostella]
MPGHARGGGAVPLARGGVAALFALAAIAVSLAWQRIFDSVLASCRVALQSNKRLTLSLNGQSFQCNLTNRPAGLTVFRCPSEGMDES